MFQYENDLLIVDELIYDPSLPTSIVVKIDNNYYMINNSRNQKPIPQNIIRPYNRNVSDKWRRAMFDHEFYFANLMPRGGFKVPLGRAITREELQEICGRYGLTAEDISKEFDDKIGMLYGKEYEKEYKAIRVKVPIEEALKLEYELQEKGIQANSVAPGTVNIRTGWGGAREGAGRKPTGRRLARIYCTEEEERLLREYLKKIRDN